MPNDLPSPLRQVKAILQAAGINRAVSYALLTRGWQLFAGPITLYLIARFFDSEVQGYYYTFASIIALQSFLELGFHVVIINVASHEWSGLNLDSDGSVVGDERHRSRLASLGRFVFRWYLAIGILFVLIVGPSGYFFFAQKESGDINWIAPWFTLVVLSGCSLVALPFHALLEGCNQVAAMNRLRFWQAIFGNIAVWCCLVLKLDLWTAVSVAVVKCYWEVHILLFEFRGFMRLFWRSPGGDTLDWRREVWPMQWRIGLQGIFTYFAYSLFVPVMWQFHGNVVAGQMGMSLTVVNTLQYAAMAWVQSRAPSFGVMASKREYESLDRTFFQMTLKSLLFLIVGVTGFCGTVVALQMHWPSFGNRFLGPDALVMLCVGALLQHLPTAQSIYVRAHKREMYLFQGIVSSIGIGLAVWLMGRAWGPFGAAAGHALVIGLFVLPHGTKLWMICRAERD